MISILTAILVLSLLVLVHELGHFAAARRLGVGVIKFSIGIGPARLGLRARRDRVRDLRLSPRRLRQDGRRARGGAGARRRSVHGAARRGPAGPGPVVREQAGLGADDHHRGRPVRQRPLRRPGLLVRLHGRRADAAARDRHRAAELPGGGRRVASRGRDHRHRRRARSAPGRISPPSCTPAGGSSGCSRSAAPTRR